MWGGGNYPKLGTWWPPEVFFRIFGHLGVKNGDMIQIWFLVNIAIFGPSGGKKIYFNFFFEKFKERRYVHAKLEL